MPTALHITWRAVVDAVIVEIWFPGFPARPDSCNR